MRVHLGNYKHDVEAAYTESHAALDRLYPLYFKTAGRLASIAELIEERIKELPQDIPTGANC